MSSTSEYRHVASGVTALAEFTYSDEGTWIMMIASSDPRVSNSPFVITDRVLKVRENPKNPREYEIPNGYQAEPLVITRERLDQEWVVAK